MEGWTWKALWNEAPLRWGRILLPAGFEPAIPWSEVGSANRLATRTLLPNIEGIDNYKIQCRPKTPTTNNPCDTQVLVYMLITHLGRQETQIYRMYEAYHIGLLITSIMRTIYNFIQVVNGFDKLSPARSHSILRSDGCSPECAVMFNNLSKRRIRKSQLC